MAKAKREITISRDYFKMVAEKVINNIGDHLNTEVYVPFVEDCAYVMSVLEDELFRRGTSNDEKFYDYIHTRRQT